MFLLQLFIVDLVNKVPIHSSLAWNPNKTRLNDVKFNVDNLYNSSYKRYHRVDSNGTPCIYIYMHIYMHIQFARFFA